MIESTRLGNHFSLVNASVGIAATGVIFLLFWERSSRALEVYNSGPSETPSPQLYERFSQTLSLLFQQVRPTAVYSLPKSVTVAFFFPLILVCVWVGKTHIG